MLNYAGCGPEKSKFNTTYSIYDTRREICQILITMSILQGHETKSNEKMSK